MLPLLTDRLLIRPFLPSDYQDLFEYLSISSTYIFEPGFPITIEESKRLANERSKGNDFLAVILKLYEKLIGHVYQSPIESKSFNTFEIGYIFNPLFHNNGYATGAIKAVINYLFQ